MLVACALVSCGAEQVANLLLCCCGLLRRASQRVWYRRQHPGTLLKGMSRTAACMQLSSYLIYVMFSHVLVMQLCCSNPVYAAQYSLSRTCHTPTSCVSRSHQAAWNKLQCGYRQTPCRVDPGVQDVAGEAFPGTPSDQCTRHSPAAPAQLYMNPAVNTPR